MASYFVGDIQGCYGSLCRLLEQVKFDPAQDILYPVGDLVARGEDSLSVAKLMLELGASVKPVLGNHDLHLLAVYSGLKKAKDSDKLQPLLTSHIIDDYCFWLRQQPLVIAWQDVVVSHAGWYPLWDKTTLLNNAQLVTRRLQCDDFVYWLELMYGNKPNHPSEVETEVGQFRFAVNALTRMRYLTKKTELELKAKMPVKDAPKTLKPWFKLQSAEMRKHTVIFGHWASLLGKTGQANLYALDTGSVWGNQMTMLRWQDKALFKA
ncbi:hypothetical protein C2869_10800 [Saccharobesus litoralis]|uniref:bis(5'-nucleosyl)-tetraphosphatase (symmetrical) n=1 Tax=Saccharobesus litoralis TaxID=2172099 RepID=A0A2S0VRU8_9ALTE|nr:symmetrical bis(5'-nucleosyl)-tetraphosphatase [Saccharobesus litoralis]AWB66892.1 hypothetical protein C2869_10800 [Saccharobesus litoralis]